VQGKNRYCVYIHRIMGTLTIVRYRRKKARIKRARFCNVRV